ncbi:MAG: DUF368 domain-containing protein [Bacteroidota bacterium]
MKSHILTFCKGLAMGAADVVPGVSGGTIAFITGIYERLLNAFKSITPKVFGIISKEGIGAAWKHIDGTFLVALFAGIFVSILSLAKALEWTIEHYPQLLWAFFFGLIVASAIYIGRQVAKWDKAAIIALLAGVIIAYAITQLSPAEANPTYLVIFFSGAIAICAMILPGISGSFILLLLGMYAHVLGAVNDRDFLFVGIFMVGCAIGLLTFSHFLSWTFKNFRNVTLALLTGFMIGALNKVWPWQNVISTRVDSKGETVPFEMQSVFPGTYDGDPLVLMAIFLIIAGFGVVFILEMLGFGKGHKGADA